MKRRSRAKAGRKGGRARLLRKARQNFRINLSRERLNQKNEAGYRGQPVKLLFCKSNYQGVIFVTGNATSSQSGCLGGHSATGPDRVGLFGIAPYANVPTKPTKSSNALSERFIGLLSP